MNEELQKMNENVWDVICGDDKDFEVIQQEAVDTWRHGTLNEVVVKSRASGKFYMSAYRDSCKDMMFSDMNGDEADFFAVVPRDKTVTVYDKITP